MRQSSLQHNIANDERQMSFGNRDVSHTPLTDKEIEYIKHEIRAIGADETKFVFNDLRHMNKSTCYNHVRDIIFVTRNVFPDTKSNSLHPRDLMSVRTVLAHEYYGHRTLRDEYLNDDTMGDDYRTTEEWSDECRASLTAAEITPNLTIEDRCNLINDAKFRAKEAFQHLDETDFMKGILYGYKTEEHNITPDNKQDSTASNKSSMDGLRERFKNVCDMPRMRRSSKTDREWEP